MKLLIDIPEETYTCCKIWANSSTCTTNIKFAIANGMILPEGHGDLIDRKELKEILLDYDDKFITDIQFYELVLYDIENATTVIEADKEEEE